MNQHYKNRYDKFINSIRNKGIRKFEGYKERHHIIPRCMKGTNEPHNLINLTLREHFLAHWLLYKTYPDYFPIVSAFLQMIHKNPKTKKGYQGRFTSKSYAILKERAYTLFKNTVIRDRIKGFVNARDSKGNLVRVTCEEFRNNNELIFHTKGMVYCYDKNSDLPAYITSDEYKEGNHYMKNTPTVVTIKDYLTGTKLNIKYEEWVEYYKNETYIPPNSFAKRKRYKLSKDFSGVDYSQKRNTFVVRNQNTGVIEVISKDEYNPKIHYTSTRNKILAKNKNGDVLLVDREEFDSGKYEGVTKNFVTVFDKVQNKYVCIHSDEFRKNKGNYVGPNVGKTNVINKNTGERKQISKQEYDSNKDKYVSLGDKKYLFLCKNILTGKQKYINIYEWHLVKEQYDVIDDEKFKFTMSIK